ncbi:MAG: hypothetical protein K9M80_08815 [Candidatus Marinimicrobia bacterium]|nr:hypothetical protein [Candidatus Neomarinimicrobiota bacterium]
MLQFMEAHDELIIWVSTISFLMFIGTLLAIPFIIIRLPSDYFIRDKNLARRFCQERPILRIILVSLKNVVGIIFFIMGFLMLFIPGQGILTMLIGYSMLDFVSMRGPVYKIIRRPTVYEFINRIRGKKGKEPIELKE